MSFKTVKSAHNQLCARIKQANREGKRVIVTTLDGVSGELLSYNGWPRGQMVVMTFPDAEQAEIQISVLKSIDLAD